MATPIGNLEDLSGRAVAIMAAVDRILAEDTRVTSVLCRRFGINTPLSAYHDHNERAVTAGLVDELRAGRSLALVSDAGTPILADPGFHLVAAARAAGIPVVAVPGASAVVAALSIAGFNGSRFQFLGFLPHAAGARQSALEALAGASLTSVVLESPHRVAAALADAEAALGPERRVAVCRELTKRHEEAFAGPLAAARAWLAERPGRVRGEFVLVFEGAEPTESVDDAALAATLEVLLGYLTPRDAAAAAARLTGARRNHAYRIAQALADGAGQA